jgi:twitching motility two-component system response regulator PilG
MQKEALTILERGVAAAKAGDKAQARRLLRAAVKQYPDNEVAWLWLAGVAATLEETVTCLQHVLQINPDNARAKKGLAWARAQAAQRPTQPMQPEPPPSRGTILVVDDSTTVRKLVAITLERHHFRVITAADGLEALAHLESEIPDVVLLDITMPNMDGYKVCKTIKSNERTHHLPVIMLSGKDGFFDKMRGRMAGSTEYLTKPFDPDELVEAVGRFTTDARGSQ